MSEPQQDDAFAILEAEGQGVWRLEVFPVTPAGFLSCTYPDASRAAVINMFKDARVAPLPPLCLTCDNETARAPHVVALLYGHCDNPTQAIGSAVCDVCAAKPWGELKAAVMARYRQWLPDARAVDIHPSSGRA